MLTIHGGAVEHRRLHLAAGINLASEFITPWVARVSAAEPGPRLSLPRGCDWKATRIGRRTTAPAPGPAY